MLYDVVIIGAGPAGALAAGLLAAQGRSILLVDQAAGSDARGRLAWVNAKAGPLLKKAGVSPGDVLNEPFSDVTFFNADLSKSAKPAFAEPPGYLVDRRVFGRVLVEAAVAAGAELREGWKVAAADLREDSVEIRAAGGESACGRMLLVATGAGDRLLGRIAGLGRMPAGGRQAAWVEATSDEVKAPGNAVSVVLGLNRQSAFGMVLKQGARVAVAVSNPGSEEEATSLHISLCQDLALKEIVPAELAGEAARAEVQYIPAGIALELDSHVAKHTLIIGDAGGFVSAASDEGIYPAMWSAQLAADVVHEALDNTHSQDVLMEFDARWRMSMAEYLRAPNTDIQFLLPLIFANQPMTDRMAAALFAGENI